MWRNRYMYIITSASGTEVWTLPAISEINCVQLWPPWPQHEYVGTWRNNVNAVKMFSKMGFWHGHLGHDKSGRNTVDPYRQKSPRNVKQLQNWTKTVKTVFFVPRLMPRQKRSPGNPCSSIWHPVVEAFYKSCNSKGLFAQNTIFVSYDRIYGKNWSPSICVLRPNFVLCDCISCFVKQTFEITIPRGGGLRWPLPHLWHALAWLPTSNQIR
jgi:hypothetical protein